MMSMLKMKPKTYIVIVCLNCLFCITCGLNPARDDCIAYESDYHFQKGCACVVYESNGRTQGTFYSPNFPQIYPTNENCILYTFIGELGEIVELTFLEFDLQMRISEGCTDYLNLFLDLERPEVNEQHHANYELCGNISMIQKKYFSSTRSLILEFHTDSYQGNNTGFRGRFGFLDKNQFAITGGNKRWGTSCTYDFYSNKISREGQFFSPSYPQNYPAEHHCQYFFSGDPHRGERVKITFHNIQLEHIVGSCEHSPDTIVVRDGESVSAPVMARYCNTLNGQQIVSSGPSLYVQFIVDNKNQRQGFSASFQFIQGDGHRESVPSTSKPGPDARDDPRVGTAESTTHATTPAGPTECQFTIRSSDRKEGVFSSPGFPSPYPANTFCLFNFIGQGRERVQIRFGQFDLYYASSDPRNPVDCEQVDAIRILLVGEMEDKLLGTYCGSKRPPIIMSHNHMLDIRFHSMAEQSAAHGFNATYKFVENFGIDVGEQQSDMPCKFRFDSWVSSNGTFTSPNFPGLYPRFTECHYIFNGRPNEKVHITFPYFDVEGLKPCSEDTMSDYVEFSNFGDNIDRKMQRFCGLKDTTLPKKEVVSDNNFLRVTFKSNSLYDATGFAAYYYFKQEVPRSSGGTISGYPPSDPKVTPDAHQASSSHTRQPWCLVLAVATVIHLITSS